MDKEEFINNEISKITEQLKKKYRPEKIILFGSRAWSRHTSSSDVDMFIIKSTDKSFPQRICEVYRVLREIRYKIPFEPIVYTPEEVKNRLELGDFFVKKILTKGKILYERK